MNFIDVKNKNQYLKKQSKLWDTYYYEGKYIKIIHKENFEGNYCPLFILLETLKNPEYQMNQICKVEEVLYHYDNFYGYICEEKQGSNIQNVIKYNLHRHQRFYEFFLSFQNILEFANLHQIVMKDMITKGNILYDKKSKTAYLIDVDSFQIPEYGDNIFVVDFTRSDLTKILFTKYKKYHNQYRLTTELNIFSLYELFLKTVYEKSILHLSAKNLPELEKKLQELLQRLSLDKHSNLYGRIMDTVNPNIPNSYDKEDFQILANKNSLPIIRRRTLNINRKTSK